MLTPADGFLMAISSYRYKKDRETPFDGIYGKKKKAPEIGDLLT